jgi:histidyl-tRNA synthetase
MQMLRRAGFSSDMDFQNRSLKAQFKTANNTGAKYVCVIGDEELQSKTVTIKDMESGKQETRTMEETLEFLEKVLA